MVLLSLVVSHVRIGFPLAALPYAMYFWFLSRLHIMARNIQRAKGVFALLVYIHSVPPGAAPDRGGV